MINRLLEFFFLFFSHDKLGAQVYLPMDSCEFFITDTLYQGCGWPSNGFIVTHCTIDIQDSV